MFELGPLPENEMRKQLAGATGLLFPSHAEGYGLPPFEAATFGVPSIVSPLRPTEIHLGDMAIYADPSDMYQWFEAIRGTGQRRYGRADQAVVSASEIPASHMGKAL